MGIGFGFQIYQIMFLIVFGIAMSSVLMTTIRGMKEWNKNNHSPRLTVPVTVVTKRTDISRRRHKGANGHHHHTSTTYYVTFEVESGDRIELQLDGSEYGLMVEGDKGKLSFQGTRFLGFERT